MFIQIIINKMFSENKSKIENIIYLYFRINKNSKMGNKPSKPPPPKPCPGTKQYATDLSNTNDRLRTNIVTLTTTRNEKNASVTILKARNDVLIKDKNDKFTTTQVDDEKRKAMKPLEDEISRNTAEISKLNSEIVDLNNEITDLTQKLRDERNITDPILSINNEASQSVKFTAINSIITSQDKYTTYYNSIRKQNEKLLDKVQNSNTNDLTYDQKAYFQYEQVSRFVQTNFLLLIAYYVFIIILIGILFFVQKNMSIYLKIGIILALSIYPFIIYTIEKFIYTWGSYTIALFSGTVYTKSS